MVCSSHVINHVLHSVELSEAGCAFFPEARDNPLINLALESLISVL